MVANKRKGAKPPPQYRSRTTRSRGKALADPAENTQHLTEQLRALGLYAAPTLGDGNCLFRALSDQLYGTESYHSRLRKDICDWIAEHKERYAPFVDDERGLEVHLQCMRQQATYGGHLELTAFAHLTRRNVKVIQPGLVYVIEWSSGEDMVPERSPSPAPDHASSALQDLSPNESQKRVTRKQRKRAEREKGVQPPPPTPVNDDDAPLGPVYVAYHDWEHFSSIRNLRGPHAGLPYVKESPAPDDDEAGNYTSPSRKRPPSKSFSKPPAKLRSKAERRRGSLAPQPALEPSLMPLTPSHVPLPESRSPSPIPESTASLTPPAYPLPPASPLPSRLYRSPKRTFDESSASSESSQSAAKRVRGTSVAPNSTDSSKLSTPARTLGADAEDGEGEIPTPPLSYSAPGSPSSSMSSLSTLSFSREPSPAVEAESASVPMEVERTLSKRERKKLGLPKKRLASVGGVRASAGKIIIPGGRFKRPVAPVASGADLGEGGSAEEWMKNGTGRVDVRGFRELKI